MRSTAVRWLFIVAFLIGMGIALAMYLPPAPRWTSQENINTLGYSDDGSVFATAPRLPADDLGELCGGPVQIRNVSDGQIIANLFESAAEVRWLDKVPSMDDTVLVAVRSGPRSAWELHLVEVTEGTSSKLDFTIRGDWDFDVTHSPSQPFAVIRQSKAVAKDERTSEAALVNMETGAIRKRWTDTMVVAWRGSTLLLAAGRTLDTLSSWDLKKDAVIAMRKDVSEFHIDEGNKHAVTVKQLPPSRQRISLWDVESGEIISEVVTPIGDWRRMRDLNWAVVSPRNRNPEVLELWNVTNKRKVGEKPAKLMEDWCEVVTVDDRTLFVMYSQSKGELSAHDVETFDLLWTRPHRRTTFFGGLLVAPGLGEGTVLVLFDNEMEILNPLTGETMRRIPLAGPHHHDPMFGYGVRKDGTLTVIGEFMTRESEFMGGWFGQLQEWWAGRRHHQMAMMSAAIDLETGSLLFHRMHRVNDPHYRFWLSPDRQSAIVTYLDHDDQRMIECWDVPERKRWGWILGAPPATLGALWLLAKGWTRWRARKPPLAA